ncbi:universal stress protein [Streptomyces sp. SID5470]|nr:universal stress protein [Streptomyces sp. SID5470]
MTLRHHVVAGVDGSLASTRALDLAADEAAHRGTALRVVYAVPDRDEAGPVLASAASRDCSAWRATPTWRPPCTPCRRPSGAVLRCFIPGRTGTRPPNCPRRYRRRARDRRAWLCTAGRRRRSPASPWQRSANNTPTWRSKASLSTPPRHTHWSRPLMGAVTHALLHRSHCPVLVVPTR